MLSPLNLPREELHHSGDTVHGHHRESPCLIDGHTAPMGAAIFTGTRAFLQARRRETPIALQGTQDGAARRLCLETGPPGVCG